MLAVIQRVSQAGVSVGGSRIAGIKRGFLVLLGIAVGDVGEDAAYMARKIAELRLFEDERGKMNLSLADIGGEVLLVSQFTLLADCRQGRRPSFMGAAKADLAEKLYLQVAELLRQAGIPVAMGQFGAMMDVDLINDGPVTVILNSRER